MAGRRELHLNLHLQNAGAFSSAWRWPESEPGDYADIRYYIRAAQLAERGAFDAVFLADIPALSDMPEYRPFQSIEPTIALATIAAFTTHIGLIGTVSSSYNEPYNIARRIASLDHTSGGRSGVNIVTTADRQAARNFGLQLSPQHGDRYARGVEFTEVVKALWQSWEADALIGDKEGGRFIDMDKVHPVRHVGPHFSVEGALNVPRSPQGRPVIVQAGGSEAGRDLAARHADAVFSVAHNLDAAHAYARDLRTRTAFHGRRPQDILIFPGIVTVIGGTEEQARHRERKLWELVPMDYGLRRLAGVLGVAAERLKLDEPLPDDIALPADGRQAFFRTAMALAGGGRMTVRQLIRAQGGGTGHRIVVGTPEQIADDIELWFNAGAADGFNVMPDVVSTGLDAFVEHVVPLLRRKAIFRNAYTDSTLRGHLGLAA